MERLGGRGAQAQIQNRRWEQQTGQLLGEQALPVAHVLAGLGGAQLQTPPAIAAVVGIGMGGIAAPGVELPLQLQRQGPALAQTQPEAKLHQQAARAKQQRGCAIDLGGLLALALVAVVYGLWRPRDVAPLLASTLKESTMLMLIIGMSLLYSYVMSHLHISQSAAQSIVAMQLSKWVLLAVILAMVIVLGFFLPPVSIILMTAPIILPPLKAAGFDLIWFGVVMTIVMEMGLIHPPVGLNIFVIKNVAPDIPLKDVIWGVMPFVGLMFVAVFLLCFFPEIATGLPNWVMGAK